MRFSNRRGFTLIEVIVVAGIIAILAGILVPMIFKEIDESKITRASADIRSISSSMFIFRKDTSQWPVLDGICAASITLLRGAGGLPGDLAAKGYDSSVEDTYDSHLSLNSGCYQNWKGPYIAIVTADPWGKSYITNAKEFSGNPVWIISAGPNGVIDTDNTAVSLAGDDVGLRLK